MPSPKDAHRQAVAVCRDYAWPGAGVHRGGLAGDCLGPHPRADVRPRGTGRRLA